MPGLPDPDLSDGDEGVHGSPGNRSTRSPGATISPEWREIHKAHTTELEKIIDYTKGGDRNDAVSCSRQMLDDNRRLWKDGQDASQLANQSLRESVAYERSLCERAKDQSSGRLKIQAHALSEMERITRFGQALDFLKYGWDSAMTDLVPLANSYVETVSGQRAPKRLPRVSQRAAGHVLLGLGPDSDTVLAAVLGLSR